MKKMLVGFIQDGRHSGIDKYLLVFCKAAHEKGVTLDFLTDEISPDMEKYLAKMGFGIYEVPSLKRPYSQYRTIKSILSEGSYDAVYFNISEAFNCMGLVAAKKCKIPVRIAHSHSSGIDRANKYVRTVRKVLHKLFKGSISRFATRRFACSSVAGQWLFNKDYEIIYNAIDGKRFLFDENLRQNLRLQLGLGTKRTLIHIGHFCYAKNNFFLMDIMKEVVKCDPDTVLLCVGSGADFEAVQDYAKNLGIYNNIKFLGVRDDVPDLLCASDIFVFPSRFEGLSITCIEAQFSGAFCVLSDAISREVQISDKVKFLPIKSAFMWAENIVSIPLVREKATLDSNAVQNYDSHNQKSQFDKILGD